MTNDDLDRALAAAAANVGPSALDTLAREVRRLQGEAEATRDDHWARIGQYERRAEAAEAERDALREQVAEVQSLVEMVKAQTDELDRRKGLITQVQHWQDHTTERALNAEAERDALADHVHQLQLDADERILAGRVMAARHAQTCATCEHSFEPSDCTRLSCALASTDVTYIYCETFGYTCGSWQLQEVLNGTPG